MDTLTFLYSSHSPEALMKLLDEVLYLFDNTGLKSSDMFHTGVFCKDVTYANYRYWRDAPSTLDIPDELTNPCSNSDSRTSYVRDVIDKVIRGEVEKPEWMIYVEEEDCECSGSAPSTFLVLVPKEKRFADLGERLLEFLYSVNLMVTACRWSPS
ncbi:MAG: hypothetical protein J6Y37_12055 [Paludibacteraceae bacterium]|nr:hypothetical protein [Paludibacteraceae bacterium]